MPRLMWTLLLCLTMSLCAISSEAQTANAADLPPVGAARPVAAWIQVMPQAVVKEKLLTEHGDEFVITIDGKDYRAITADHAKAIIADKQRAVLTEQELKLRETEVSQLKAAIRAAEDAAKIADLRAQLADEKWSKAQIIIADQKLLLDRADQLIGRRGWLDKILGNIYGKMALNVALPLANLYFSQRAKH